MRGGREVAVTSLNNDGEEDPDALVAILRKEEEMQENEVEVRRDRIGAKL